MDNPTDEEAGRIALPPYAMRVACCGRRDGYIEKVGPNSVVRCIHCRRYKYHAPKSETGEAVRPVGKREALPPSQRRRILERAGFACEFCGQSAAMHGVLLQVDHLIPANEREALGMSAEEIESDDNLFCACEACNLGKGDWLLSPRVILAMIRRRQDRMAR